jgi:hypothetical protein
LWSDAALAPFHWLWFTAEALGEGGIIAMSPDKPQDFYIVLTEKGP